ncbi:MAG TPA: B12-binding domain-containing radical SAM protein [Firmicutes bacterium]|nr:B12-binding domain-containing radical SAM protein [Bacillota bacterium]
MKILLVYPRFPETFWSFTHALKFINKKAAHPPLGLLTVAGLLPRDWELKLVDQNVTTLKDADLAWADYVFISAMAVQKEGVRDLITRCQRLERRIVAGGPLFTVSAEDYPEVDHLVLGEAELTLPRFLADLAAGNPRHLYTADPDEWADLSTTPQPRWDLLDMKKYNAMSLQYSRGCPFDCDFCDITLLYGHKPRTKSIEQVLAEFEDLYAHGWRGGVFMVDDNFIGNKEMLKQELLPAMDQWLTARGFPFTFNTQASINMADDDKLLEAMVKVGFESVFIGIETPHEGSLTECNKLQNKNRDLLAAVKKIQRHGLQVQGGFILGFDQDPPTIFERQIEFIQQSGIVTAMVGLLNVLKGTKLYQRMEKEGRILTESVGNNTNQQINYQPMMSWEKLLAGYKRVTATLYTPKYFCRRVIAFLKEYNPPRRRKLHLRLYHLTAFAKALFWLGIWDQNRWYFWRLVGWSLLKKPRVFPLAVTYSIYGYHFRKFFLEQTVAAPVPLTAPDTSTV